MVRKSLKWGFRTTGRALYDFMASYAASSRPRMVGLQPVVLFSSDEIKIKMKNVNNRKKVSASTNRHYNQESNWKFFWKSLFLLEAKIFTV